MNDFVDAQDSSPYVQVSFKKFLRNKAIYSADKVAVVCAGKNYTWKEIDRCSSIIAANSINRILTFYAVQRLGAIAVLVNFNLCAKEISSLVDYANVTHFFYGEMSASLDEIKNLCGDKIQTFYSFRNDMNFKARPAVINEFRIVRDFANAIAGSTIYLPEKIRSDSILDLISRERCTIFHSVPTMFLALINNKNFGAEKLSSLRCSIISGARATESQIKIFQKLMPNNHFMSSKVSEKFWFKGSIS